MRTADWRHIVDPRKFADTPEFALVKGHIIDGIAAIKWPDGSDSFRLNPIRKGNGVKPIKDAFIKTLRDRGWNLERDSFDAYYTYTSDQQLPFVVEWETGNISSSHRAINRIAKGIIERRIVGGVLVVPTRSLYIYLTDRVGNAAELEPYIKLWEKWNQVVEFSHGYFGIVQVEHDLLDASVPTITKGTDGRALL